MRQILFEMLILSLMTRQGTKAQKGKIFAASPRLCLRSLFSILFIAFAVWRMETAVAQNEVVAQMTAVQPVAHIGEPIELVLAVNHPAGWRAIAPQLMPEWGDFEVRQQSAVTVVATGNGGESSQMTVTIMAWQLGEFSTPALPVTVSNPQGELVEVTADPITIHVESVLTEDDLALRDIKPQATLPLPLWWPWLAGVLALAGLLGVLWWRGHEGGTAVPFVDNQLPYQIALDELDGIAASGLAGRGDFKRYYTQTTDVLRRYLDGALALQTEEQTTAEIRQAIQPLAWEIENKKLLLNLLTEADLVKFARVRPTVADAQRATEEAKKFVLAVQPKNSND